MMRVRDLGFAWNKKRPLFQGLDWELEHGALYGLLGKNGAGKTTLLHLMAGLLTPQTGSIDYHEAPMRLRHPDQLADLFLLPESFKVPMMSPITYGKLFGPLYPRFDDAAYRDYLRDFEVDETLPLPRHSYGQQKKALISFGLASGVSLFLLDEPTNGLDIPSKSQFRKLVASGMSEDRTFVISTHQARDLQSLIDPVVILEHGKVIVNASLETLQSSFRIRQTRTMPQSNFLHRENVLDTWTVLETRGGELPAGDTELALDLEIIFNAAIENPQAFAGLANSKEHA